MQYGKRDIILYSTRFGCADDMVSTVCVCMEQWRGTYRCFDWCQEDMEGSTIDLLAGRVHPEHIPELPPRVVKVYLSAAGQGKLIWCDFRYWPFPVSPVQLKADCTIFIHHDLDRPWDSENVTNIYYINNDSHLRTHTHSSADGWGYFGVKYRGIIICSRSLTEHFSVISSFFQNVYVCANYMCHVALYTTVTPNIMPRCRPRVTISGYITQTPG